MSLFINYRARAVVESGKDERNSIVIARSKSRARTNPRDTRRLLKPLPLSRQRAGKPRKIVDLIIEMPAPKSHVAYLTDR